MEELLTALKQGNLKHAKHLIKTADLNLNLYDQNGATALQYAIENGSIEIIKLLLLAGADPNYYNNKYETEDLYNKQLSINDHLRHYNNSQLNLENIIKEIKNLKTFSALHTAIKLNNLECLELLLEFGADPNITDCGECTPLHWAAAQNNVLAAKYLLNANANINATDLAQSTALHEAVRKKNPEMIALLLQYNADPNIRDLDELSAFDLIQEDPSLLNIMLLNSTIIPEGIMIH